MVDVALVGMRTAAEVEANAQIWQDVENRIDIAALHARYVAAPLPLAGEVN